MQTSRPSLMERSGSSALAPQSRALLRPQFGGIVRGRLLSGRPCLPRAYALPRLAGLRSTRQTHVYASATGGELESLREENAKLRQGLLERLQRLPLDKRGAFLEEYVALQRAAAAAGEALPQLDQAAAQQEQQQAEVDGEQRAAEAAAWIKAWRERNAQQAAAAPAGEEGNAAARVAEARAWIEAWRARSAAPAPAAAAAAGSPDEDAAARAGEARAWIEAWRARSAAAAAAAPAGAAGVEGASSNGAVEARAWIEAWRACSAAAPAAAAAADSGSAEADASARSAEVKAWIEAWRTRSAAAAASAAASSNGNGAAPAVPAGVEETAWSAPEPGVKMFTAADGTLIFKFASSSAPAPTIGNGSKATAMAVPPDSASYGAGKVKTAAPKAKNPAGESQPAAAAPASESPVEPDGKAAAAPKPEAAESKAATESKAESKADTESKGESKVESKAAAAPAEPEAAGPKEAKKAPAVAPPPPPKPDPWAAARAEATAAARDHNPAAVVKGRETWMYMTAPEPAVAGAEVTLYFNRAQSEVLRNRPRIQLHVKFNTWELDSPSGDRLDMAPAPVPKAEGTDFWSVKFLIPEEAFELNFIFSDGDGAFDNNSNQNYVLPVKGPMTRDLWIDTAPERAAAAYQARKEAERIQREKEEVEKEQRALQQDLDRAREAVNQLKGGFFSMRDGGAKEMTGANDAPLWRTVPGVFCGGQKVKIQYNRKASPLHWLDIAADKNLLLKIGCNGWRETADLPMKRVPAAAKPAAAEEGATAGAAAATAAASAAAAPAAAVEEWWEAEYDVPAEATVLNFVVNYFDHWDNNQQRDYKVLVDLPRGLTLNQRDIDTWAEGLLDMLRKREFEARKAAEAAAAERERKRMEARREVQDHSEEVRRRQMRHVLFTQPTEIHAGEEVEVYYNPNNTSLAGSGQVWIRGGFNRWRHPKPFGPILMTPPETGDHHRVTIKVPKDAYCLDFVFSNAEEGGAYDNRGGLDYHLPTEGSVVEEPPLYVCHVAVELAPICKVGGLGDVVTSLGRAVQENGHQVEVVLPRYAFFQHSPLLTNMKYETEFDFAGTRVYVTSCVVEGLRCWFLDPKNGTFDSNTVYLGSADQGRFEFFSKCALEFLLRTGRQPDILHCHDWSSADVARFYWEDYHQYGLWKPKVVFTIHNLEFGVGKLGSAAYYSQRFTTVSPTYAFEIGGHPAIAPNAGKLMGIRNGIDIDIWDPETDIFLPMHYNADTCAEGKAAAREALRRRLNLTSWGDKPLVGVVSRLTAQKGIHLIKHAAFRTLDRSGQFVLLGSAPDPRIQGDFNNLAQSMGGQDAAFCFAFDEPLSHLIYAACDFILVPSMFEPCGLTQMIAMRYGAIPVVRSTGGLHDTVFDVDSDKARAAWEMEGLAAGEGDGSLCTNGFSFEGTDEGALDYALNRALDAWYNDRQWTRGLQQRVMRQDWSWNKPAIDYIELYYAALKG